MLIQKQQLIKIQLYKYIKQVSFSFFSYIVFFFSSILAAGLILLNLFLPGLFLIIVPFLVIPLLFAAQFASSAIGEGHFMSLKGFFACFGLYFTEHFRSTYKVIKTSLISFGIFLAIFLTSNLVVFTSFNSTNFLNTQAFVEDIANSDMGDITVIETLIEQYRFLLDTYLICTLLPSSFIFVVLVTYFMSLNSYSMFYRISCVDAPGRAIAVIYERTLKANRKLFVKCHWGLNYPLVILFLGGFALGGYIGFLYSYNFNSIFTFGLAIAVFISFAAFGPKYFANKHAIADYLAPHFYQELNKSIKSDINIDDLLKKLNDLPDDTKKDSEES